MSDALPPLLSSNTRIDLSRSRALLLDDNRAHLDMLGGVLNGFDLRKQNKCETVLQAQDSLYGAQFDLVMVEAAMAKEDGFEFIRWMRRSGPENNRTAPVLVVTGATRADEVAMARDSGANFVVAKPVTPIILLQRIVWLGRDARMFVEAESYVGPDRRFKAYGPPLGTKGRRRDDLNAHIGLASEPNMSQNEIDMLVRPSRVVL
jgi:DNA-binding response OmpR family regulator